MPPSLLLNLVIGYDGMLFLAYEIVEGHTASDDIPAAVAQAKVNSQICIQRIDSLEFNERHLSARIHSI